MPRNETNRLSFKEREAARARLSELDLNDLKFLEEIVEEEILLREVFKSSKLR